MTKRYVVRVELHKKNGKEPDYAQLHKEMEKEGFARTEKFGSTEKELPTGLYIGESPKAGKTRTGAVLKAEDAAKATGFTCSIVVVETERGLKSFGLKKA